jgi:methyl coenzyme M reductase gamma subunit
MTDGNKLAEIREIYFKTTRATILKDLDRAIDILKSMDSEKERERATVYMQGLAEMRKEFGKSGKPPRAT